MSTSPSSIPAPVYTPQLPTQPGGYWVKRSDGKSTIVEITRKEDGSLWIVLDEPAIPLTSPEAQGHRWAGPLPFPVEEQTQTGEAHS